MRWTVLAIVGAVALLLGLFALAISVDRHEDRDRPLYHDVILMSALQYDLLRQGRPGLELSLAEGSAPVDVGGTTFQVSPGVNLVVERRGEGICVQGTNEHGDRTHWHCVDGTGNRPALGALD